MSTSWRSSLTHIAVTTLIGTPLVVGIGGHVLASNDRPPVTGCLNVVAHEVADHMGIDNVSFVTVTNDPDYVAYVRSDRPDQVVLDTWDLAWQCAPGQDDAPARDVIAHELGHVAQYRAAGTPDARYGGAIRALPAHLRLHRIGVEASQHMPDTDIPWYEVQADCVAEAVGLRVTASYGEACTTSMLTNARDVLAAGQDRPTPHTT